jgi:excisionase family DNA binding protein
MTESGLLGIQEAADFLGISIHTLYSWVSQRKIPFTKVGRLTKFKKEDMDKWLDARTFQPGRA